MLLLNERWELLRISALDVQTRVHSKLAQVQMQKIEELRALLTNTEDQISRMPEIDPSPEAMPQQIASHKALEASLNEQKNLVDDLSNLVVIVNDDSFSDLEDKLAALGERWTHVVKWTKNRFEKIQNAHYKWKLLNRRFALASEWLDVRENDLKQMESQPISAIGSVLERMQNLRFCAMDLNVLYDNLMELQQIAQEVQVKSEFFDRLENLDDRCEALREIVGVQQQRIEGMGFDFNVDILENIKLPNGWDDFQAKLNKEPEITDAEECEKSPQSNKKRKLQKTEKQQQLDQHIQAMIDFVTSAEEVLATIKSISSVKDQRKTLEQLQIDLKQKITNYPTIKTFLNECSEADGLNVTAEANEISNIGSKYDEISFRIEHLLELNDKEAQRENFLRNLTGLKLVLADCQDWFKQYANLNASTQDELESRLLYMDSLNNEIADVQEFIRNADDMDVVHRWQLEFDQFHQSWIDIKRAIKRLLDDNFGAEDFEESSNSMEIEKTDAMIKFEEFLRDTNETKVIISNMHNMESNLQLLCELKSIADCTELTKSFVKDSIQLGHLQKIYSSLTDCIAKQKIGIENLNRFTLEYDNVIDFLKHIQKTLNDDFFMLGELDNLKRQSVEYEKNGLELKKIDIDMTSVKNFSDVIISETTDSEHKTELLAKIESLNSLNDDVKKIFEINAEKLKSTIEQTENILKRIDDTEKWLNDLEKTTPNTTNAQINTSNELFQLRTKFQSLKEACEQKTIEFRELNEAGSEMLLQIDELLNQPQCKQKYSSLTKQFTKLNARWNEVTALVYSRTGLLEHISGQLGEFKTLIVSETGYLDKLEKCLRKSPENAADAEEIYEELDVITY